MAINMYYRKSINVWNTIYISKGGYVNKAIMSSNSNALLVHLLCCHSQAKKGVQNYFLAANFSCFQRLCMLSNTTSGWWLCQVNANDR
jgi:hypothetical protein